MKLNICGRKKSRRVSVEWPKMPATASDMPAKYVNVSPTNTREGNLSAKKKKVGSGLRV